MTRKGFGWLIGIGTLALGCGQVGRPPAQPVGELRWSSIRLDGNANKFFQYAHPPRGFVSGFHHGSPVHRLLWQGGDNEDRRGDLEVRFQFGRLALGGSRALARFYDPAPSVMVPSERKSDELFLRYLLTPDLALTVRSWGDSHEKQFAPPRAPLDQSTSAWDFGVEGIAGRGRLLLQYTRWRYHDRTGVRPDVTLQRWSGGYLWQPTPTLGLEANWSELRFQQPGRPDSRLQSLVLFGEWFASPATEVGIRLQRERWSLPIVKNAWASEKRSGILAVTQQVGQWRLQVNFHRQAIERWNHEQSFLEPIQRESVSASLSGRLTGETRLSFYGTLQQWRRSVQEEEGAHTTLFWSKKQTGRLNLTTTLHNGYTYLTFSRQSWENAPRALRLQTDQVLVGGSWQIRNRLNLFAEHRREHWKGEGGPTGLLALPLFLPETRSVVLGANWRVATRTQVRVLYIHFASGTPNPLLLPDGNVEARLLTISLHYTSVRGSTLSITIAPWHYRDRVSPSMESHLQLVQLGWSGRF